MPQLNLRQIPLDGWCYLIGDVLDVQVPMPASIYRNCSLIRPPESSHEFISSLIQGCSLWASDPFANSFDSETTRISPLLPSERRYHIVQSLGEPIPNELAYASCIVEPGYYLGPGFGLGGGGYLTSGPNLSTRYSSVTQWWNKIKPVSAESLAEWRELSGAIDLKRVEIRHSIQMYYSLMGKNPIYDSLTLLGYFMVIESLLTHKPDPKDPTSSIGRQIREKMKLLSRRMKTPLNYTMFGGIDPDDAWPALYDFRSTIAHGSRPDFSQGKTSKLRSNEAVIDFMQAACRGLLRQAIREPDLCLDLKHC